MIEVTTTTIPRRKVLMENINWPGWVSCAIALGSLIYTGWLHRQMKKEKDTIHIPISTSVKFPANPYRITISVHQMAHTEYITSISVKNGKIRLSKTGDFVERLNLYLPVPGLDIRPITPDRSGKTLPIEFEITLPTPSKFCILNFTLASGRTAAENTISLIS